jgi:hypothetical protein
MSNKYFELVPITKDINHGEYIVAYNESDPPHLWVESSYYGCGKWTNLERTDSMRLPKFYVSHAIPTQSDEKEAEKYYPVNEKEFDYHDGSHVVTDINKRPREAFLAGILRERASGKGWVNNGLVSEGIKAFVQECQKQTGAPKALILEAFCQCEYKTDIEFVVNYCRIHGRKF